jgi:hypothetical protein
LRLDEWIRINKKRISVLVVVLIIVFVLWYMWFPYPTPSIVEFINVEVDITLNETEPEIRVPADFGPHCREVHLYGDRVVIDNNILDQTTEVVVRIDYEMHHHEARAFDWNLGCGIKHYLLDEKETDLELVGAANETHTMTIIHVEANDLTIDGETIPPGDVWEGTFVYPVMNGRYTVTERVVLENMGYSVAWSKRPSPCD